MQHRRLGQDGPLVSAIGLGCMRMTPMGGAKEGSGRELGIRTIQTALDAGITLLNTGDFYGHGANEMLVGEAIKGHRDQAFLSVKMGSQRGPSGGFLGHDCRPASIKNFCAYSLQRLGVDHIDLYQPSRFDPDVPVEDQIGAIAELIEEGKVRYIGVSEYNAEQLRRAAATHPIAALEIEYSLASRFIEDEILATARELGIAIIPYSVVTQGLLAGSYSDGPKEGDIRGIFPKFQGENLKKNLAAVEILRLMADGKGITPAQLAIAWVLAKGDDFVPIIGMSKPERVAENLGALDVDLTADDMTSLDEAFPPGTFAGGRYPGILDKIVAS
jgi:aryl-alcohol dehydrogenase-like predicted oxidoreductase